MPFEVKTSITREGCRAQAAASLAHHIREICLITTILALATAVLYAIRSPKVEIVGAIFAVVALYNLLAIPMTSMRLYSSRNSAVDSIFLAFENDSLRVSTNVEDTWIDYDQITHMAENSGFYILYAKHHTPLTFKKTEVLGGRADELKVFLEKQTGQTFRPFRG